MSGNKKAEQRRVERLDLNIPVDLKRIDRLEPAAIDDLTPDGVFIATDQEYEQGTPIELHLEFPAGEQADSQMPKKATVPIQGEVVWCGKKLSHAKRKVISGIGVRFTNMDADTLELVVTLYERLHAKMS